MKPLRLPLSKCLVRPSSISARRTEDVRVHDKCMQIAKAAFGTSLVDDIGESPNVCAADRFAVLSLEGLSDRCPTVHALHCKFDQLNATTCDKSNLNQILSLS